MFEQDTSPQIYITSPADTVIAYLRLPNSQSIKLQLSPLLQLNQLQTIIADRLNIPLSAQIIYYKGKQLRQGKAINISDRAIFHIKDKRQMLQQISIDIVFHRPQHKNFFKINHNFTRVTVNQEEVIGEFLKKYLGKGQQGMDLKGSRVIDCGRFLKMQKTFKEMNIQQQAQIHIIVRQKKAENGVTEEESNEEHEQLISRVLKHSRQNSIELPKQKLDTMMLAQQDNNAVLQIKDKIIEQDSHICNFAQEEGIIGQQSLIQSPSEIFGKSNPQLDKSIIKSQSTLLLNHTKSSQKFIRQKSGKQELTPLKLGLRKYKRFEGPLSVRACNCKKKSTQSQHHLKSSQSEHGSTLSPCLANKSTKSHTNKSDNKLKKSCALIN